MVKWGSEVYSDLSCMYRHLTFHMNSTCRAHLILSFYAICVCFKVTAYNWVLLFHFIQFDNFYLLTGVFRRFICHVIIDMVKFKSILLFVSICSIFVPFFNLLDHLRIF